MKLIDRTGNKSSLSQLSLYEWMMACCGFSVLLLAIRVLITNSPMYLFLCWNLFLAIIPYWITRWLSSKVSIIENKTKFLLVIVIWLLFIPNSFYIITDFLHFPGKSNEAFGESPKWFDMLMLFSFAWNGLLFGILSLRRIELIITMVKGPRFSFLFICSVMLLSGFGIYIGRYLRYNSWDVIAAPFSLAGEMIDILIHPFDNSYAWGVTLCYGFFMLITYYTLQKITESRS